MRKIFIILLITVATVSVAFAAAKTNKPHHQNAGLACSDCHGSGDVAAYQPAETEKCLSCHGSLEEVADLTKHLDAEEINPHNSYHYGPVLDCFVCHSEHRPSQSLCTSCHDASGWMNAAP